MKFNIGDIVYSASYGQKTKEVTCPVCFGKLKITVILGNGDSVETDCDYCGKGYEGPKGFIIEYDYIAEAKIFFVDKIEVAVGKDKETRTYYSMEPEGYRCVYYEDTCFANKDEALKAAIAIKDKQEEEQRTQARYLKRDIHKSYSWNVGYHMREAKRNRRSMEYHEEQARLCKERVK